MARVNSGSRETYDRARSVLNPCMLGIVANVVLFRSWGPRPSRLRFPGGVGSLDAKGALVAGRASAGRRIMAVVGGLVVKVEDVEMFNSSGGCAPSTVDSTAP